jgi:hypothetical protein
MYSELRVVPVSIDAAGPRCRVAAALAPQTSLRGEPPRRRGRSRPGWSGSRRGRRGSRSASATTGREHLAPGAVHRRHGPGPGADLRDPARAPILRPARTGGTTSTGRRTDRTTRGGTASSRSASRTLADETASWMDLPRAHRPHPWPDLQSHRAPLHAVVDPPHHEMAKRREYHPHRSGDGLTGAGP